MPNHHPDDHDLGEYASGSADEAEAILIATHLALCPRCRAVVDEYDDVGGVLLTEQAPVDVTAGSLEALMARLDEPAPTPTPIPPASGPNDIPMPLRQYTGSLSQVSFRTVAPGIRRFDLPMSTKDRPVALVGLRPGLVVPTHRHAAAERGLVLQGGFTDELGHFVRGDLSLRGPDEEHDHEQRIDKGPECIVLMVDDGPKIPTTVVGKVVNYLFGM